MNNKDRIDKVIAEYTDKFRLDLSGLTLFTECASGYYAYTPMIAGLAGAKKIYAIAKDSEYGKKTDLRDDLLKLAREYGIDEKIEVVFSKKTRHLGEADIITNTRSVRPIDKKTVSCLKPTAVIPLMYETWEFRPQDVDMAECRKREIALLGTDEEHPDVSIYPALGYIAFKLMLDAGLEIFDNKILLMGSGKNGRSVFEHFKTNGLDFKWFTLDKDAGKESREYTIEPKSLKIYLKDADCIFVVEHLYRDELIGRKGFIKPVDIKPFTKVVHFCGKMNENDLISSGVDYYPRRFAPPGYVSVGADYLGAKFVLKLLTAGLKVGEVMARCRLKGMNLKETASYTVDHAPAEDFKKECCVHE